MIQKNRNDKNTSSKTGIIHLENLVLNKNYEYQDKFYVELNPELKKELYKNLLKTCKTIKNLSKEINVKFTRLWDQLRRVPISIEMLNKISKYLVKRGYNEYKLKNLEKEILYIKSTGSKSQKVYNPKFPINLKTLEGLRFISHLYHDGSIGKFNKQPQYTNQSKKEVQEFLRDSIKLFGDFKREIKYDFGHGIKKKKYFIINLPTVIGEIMIKAGFIPGDKTRNNPEVFTFIKKLSNKKMISEFITKAFNDECHVRDREITLGQSTLIKGIPRPSKILLLDNLLLKRLGIRTRKVKLAGKYINKDGLVAKFILGIYSKQDLSNFNKSVKLIRYKRDKLEEYLIRTREAT